MATGLSTFRLQLRDVDSGESSSPARTPKLPSTNQCSPTAFSPIPITRSFQLKVNGVFSDVMRRPARRAGVARLGVVIARLRRRRQGRLYVANDMTRRSCFTILGGMKFEERAVALSGVPFSVPGGHRIAALEPRPSRLRTGSGRPSLLARIIQDREIASSSIAGKWLCRLCEAIYRGLGGQVSRNSAIFTCVLSTPIWIGILGPDVYAMACVHSLRVAKVWCPYAQASSCFLGTERENIAAPRRRRRRTSQPRVGRGLASAIRSRRICPIWLSSGGFGATVALFFSQSFPATSNNFGNLPATRRGRGTPATATRFGATVATTSSVQTDTFVVGGGRLPSPLRTGSCLLWWVGGGGGVGGIILESWLAGETTRSLKIRWPSGRSRIFSDLPARCRWRLNA